MIGAAIVLVLGGLVVPITLLLVAAAVDASVVVWVLLHEWHDHWAPRLGRAVARPVARWRQHATARHA